MMWLGGSFSAIEALAVSVKERHAYLAPADAARYRAVDLVEIAFAQELQRTVAGEDVQGHVRLRRVLAPGRAATDLRVSAVEVGDELAAGRAAVAYRTVRHIAARPVHDDAAVASEDRLHVVPYRPGRRLLAFGEDRDRHHALHGKAVLDGHLRLHVQPAETPLAEALSDLAGEPVVLRHVAAFRVVHRHAPEDALVAPAVAVHSLRDVRRLLRDMHRHLHAASADRVALAPLGDVLVRVADAADRLAAELGELRVRVAVRRSHLAGERAEAVLQLRLKGDSGVPVPLEIAVEYVCDDVVAGAVGMPDRAVFRCLYGLCHFLSRFPPRLGALVSGLSRVPAESGEDRVYVETRILDMLALRRTITRLFQRKRRKTARFRRIAGARLRTPLSRR